MAFYSISRVLREMLPLETQVSLRELKYKFARHPLWEDEEFISYYHWLDKTQWWSKEEFEQYQLEKLHALVNHAYENTAYYRRVFDKVKIKPSDIVTLEDINKLPLLTKDDVRNNLEDLVARNIDRSSLCYRTTSGSTGIPLGVYQDKHTSYLHELALVYRQRNWAGWRFGDRYMVLRGNAPPGAGVKGRSHWYRYDFRDNKLMLSSFDMTEENLFRYDQKIKEFKPEFIYSDSSSLEILARFMKRNSISNPSVKAIFLGSQTIYPSQRSFIESVFGCKIFARYGMTEKAIDAVECEKHQGYHVGMEYGILELLNQYNETIDKPGTPGRVVGTGFDTYCMPLIRYVTDDIAEYSPNTCSCKRQSTLISDFKGRLSEFIVSKNGFIVPLSPVYGSIHGMLITKIREMKFVQEREGELVIRLILAPSFSKEEVAKEFLDEMYSKLDTKEFDVRIDFVDHIPRTGRGKLGLLDQKLPIKVEYLQYFEDGNDSKET